MNTNNTFENTNTLNEMSEKKNKSYLDLSLLGRKILNMVKLYSYLFIFNLKYLLIIFQKFEKKSINHEFTINDLNNFVGADRKIVVNDTYEFWVHDFALQRTSKYFKENFSGERRNIKDDIEKKNDITMKKTYVYVPHS